MAKQQKQIFADSTSADFAVSRDDYRPNAHSVTIYAWLVLRLAMPAASIVPIGLSAFCTVISMHVAILERAFDRAELDIPYAKQTDSDWAA